MQQWVMQMYDLDDIISVPEYYQKMVDPGVDLNVEHSIPCKFHGETTGKSFSYSPEKKVWRCWGKCHCGGKVVELHKLNYHLKTEEEARASLIKVLGLAPEDNTPTFEKKAPPKVSEETVKKNVLIAKAERIAKTPDDWIELDYIMSQHPVDVTQLEIYCEERSNNTNDNSRDFMDI